MTYFGDVGHDETLALRPVHAEQPQDPPVHNTGSSSLKERILRSTHSDHCLYPDEDSGKLIAIVVKYPLKIRSEHNQFVDQILGVHGEDGVPVALADHGSSLVQRNEPVGGPTVLLSSRLETVKFWDQVLLKVEIPPTHPTPLWRPSPCPDTDSVF